MFLPIISAMACERKNTNLCVINHLNTGYISKTIHHIWIVENFLGDKLKFCFYPAFHISCPRYGSYNLMNE